MELLDREIKYLLNKVKIWRPKQENVANQTTDSKTEENEESIPDTENDKFTEEQTPSDNEVVEEQQEPMLKTIDATQEPLVFSENKEPQLSDEQAPGKEHQEL